MDGSWTVRTQPAPNDVAACLNDPGGAGPAYYHMPFEDVVRLK